MQAKAPASSTSFMTQPPCTLPRLLACSGCINWAMLIFEALIALAFGASAILVHIRAELAAIACVQAFRLFKQHVDLAMGQLAHHWRQRYGGRGVDFARRRRRVEARFERVGRSFADNALIITQISGVIAHYRVDFPLGSNKADPVADAVKDVRIGKKRIHIPFRGIEWNQFSSG